MPAVKIFTHEVIVHSQINAIEKTLNRDIHCEITLNIRTVRSFIEFDANNSEIDLIKANLGYTVMIKQQNRWWPSI